MLVGLMIAAAASAAAPGVEAEALGRRLAAAGALATMLPIIGARETEEMIAAHPELTGAERIQFHATAKRVEQATTARIEAALGHQYAQTLSLDDLKALVVFNEGDVARRYRTIVPQATAAAMQSAGKVDFKGDVLAAFCKETGKLCPQ